MMKIQTEIKNKILEEGFELVGFLNKNDCEFGPWIDNWLAKEFHAEMRWMEKHNSIRQNPCNIESWANSVISVAINYYSETPKLWGDRNPISNYAWGEDYHLVVRKKLKKVVSKLKEIYPDFQGREFVDTAPIPEKIIAAKCGIGWIGKNSMLINRRLGSYLFLGEIITNLDLISDKPQKDYCGTCKKCIEACPTGAICNNKMVDSNKCISYLTIEKRGDFSESEKKNIDYQVFGCDICQQVCPWNKKITTTSTEQFKCLPKWLESKVFDTDAVSIDYFEKLKIKSPIKRTKYEGFIRNLEAIKQTKLNP